MTKSDFAFDRLEGVIVPALEAVETRLQETVVGYRKVVDDLTRHLAVAGGKRLRPLLCLLCAQLGDPEKATSPRVLDSCLVVEMTHLATLYHDDVMDDAPVRRGAPAAQEVWGNNRAILAGDVLLGRVSRICADLGIEAVRMNAATFERLCLGQLNETFGPEPGDDPVQFYLQVLADKTGSLVALAAQFGAKEGGADAQLIDMVGRFGEKVGVAFQIADDVLDLRSASQQSGKTPGTDLREGVDTLPVLLLRQRQKAGTIDAAGERILQMLAQGVSDDESLAQVVQAFRAHPVLDEVSQMASKWVEDAIAELDILPAGDVRDALEAFAHSVVDRDR